jgi:transketolase C-terminal domain/subunit
MKFGSGTVRLAFSMPIKEASSKSDIATITADLEDDSKIGGYYNRFTNRHYPNVG